MENNYFKTRRSIRKFTDKEVSNELIEKMLQEAMQAPTTGNMQLYSVVVTRDDEMRDKLSPCHFNQPASKAPVLLTFCADTNRFVKWCESRGAVAGFDNLQSFMAAVFDTTIVAQQFCTIAEMNGLGTCYLGTTTYTAPQIAELLELPDRVVPLLTVALGYPAEDGAVSDRLPVSSILHYETYKDYSNEDIDKAYSYKESLEENKGFVKENGKKTLAQVFADVRYPKSNNEQFSEIFSDFLRDVKFGN